MRAPDSLPGHPPGHPPRAPQAVADVVAKVVADVVAKVVADVVATWGPSGWTGARMRIGAAVAALFVASCLPEAGPGIGTHVFEGRRFSTLRAGPSGPTGRALLFRQPGAPPADPYALPPAGVPFPMAMDLFQAPAQPGRPARRLATDVAAVPFGDARGRLFVTHGIHEDVGFGPFVPRLARLDLQAGTRTDLGPLRQARQSPGGTQAVIERLDGSFTTLTLDDRQHEIGGGHNMSLFVGEHACFLTIGRLACAAPDGSPPVVVAMSGDGRFQPLAMPDGAPTLLVEGSSRDGWGFDLVRVAAAPPLVERVALANPRSEVAVSAQAPPRFAFVEGEGSALRLRVVDVTTRADHLMPLPGLTLPPGRGARLAEAPRFRPGSDEVWLMLGAGRLAIARPSGRDEVVEGDFQSFARFQWLPAQPDLAASTAGSAAVVAPGPGFTADGRLVAYQTGDGGVHLAAADAPAQGSRLRIAERGHRGLGEVLGSGRIVSWLSRSSEGFEVRVFDAAGLVELSVLEDVRQVVIGPSRLLSVQGGLPHYGLAPGTLLLTTQQGAVPLAENVIEFALWSPSCPTCDPLAPGTALAYLVHARVPWKHDGLWYAELP